MQCMSSPTRKEIDQSHTLSPFIPLQIGVPGIRNLSKIKRHRVILWCLLGLSSAPLHLFYNSAVFSSISSNNYWAISASESFIRDANCSHCSDTTGEFSSILNRLWNNASAGVLERLDPADCITSYATSIQSTRRNVLLVASNDKFPPANENAFINGSHVYWSSVFRAKDAMARDTARDSFDWICSGIDSERECSVEIGALKSSNSDAWVVSSNECPVGRVCNEPGYSVEYCLSEQADATCKLHFEPSIGIIITILNFVKAGVMLYAAFCVRDEPFMTLGDAVASFLEQPDPISANMCLSAFPDYKGFTDFKGVKHYRIGARKWTDPQYRWKDVISTARLALTIFMFLAAFSVAGIFLVVGINALPPGTTLSQLEFPIDMRNFPNSTIAKVVLANTPQLIFSLLYFYYNALLTAMLMGYEWVSYAHKRKGLHVSRKPKGAQRCTYFLQLPYRFSIPLLMLSATLHWLVSQSLFLMSIDFYDASGRPGDGRGEDSEFFGYQTVAYSPLAIISLMVLGGIMMGLRKSVGADEVIRDERPVSYDVIFGGRIESTIRTLGSGLPRPVNRMIELHEMYSVFTLLLVNAAAAVTFPPPTGPYHVGYKQHVFNKTTPNDPVAPANASSILLGTFYYPTLTIPIPGNNTSPYLDPTTAKLWGDILQYPNNSLQSFTTWNVLDAPPLDTTMLGLVQKPTVIFSPGGGENAVMYNALNAELASQGYTVLALDHPGETPYLQLPNGAQGIYGIDITASWNITLQTAVYRMRVSDTLAIVRDLFPAYVKSTGAPFNTTHYLALGHSVGGAASAGALAVEPAILGGMNLDGRFFDLPDVKKPFLMLAGAEHTDIFDPTMNAFAANQSGWYQWLNITGTNHQNFADLDDWVDLQGLRNETITPSLDTIWAPRMDYIVKTLVEAFFGFVLGDNLWFDEPSEVFPEIDYARGSTGTG
ncbi:hypothetical protein TW65_86917 [Stemphylium lycopersici]|uniref:Alpha/Beta hydrolase protein n=1 Tax=Stemphylium lycopersici TaxID=183478 RepID=A0A364NDI7_STELY|nr:hypothetical protein TW65_86917 [Stemphylium lycopersici]RAR15346.1 Alpha/Beta hydrolase protein [Stemphylium lycopersici]